MHRIFFLPVKVNEVSGVGAGQDSFFEYLLKSSILFREDQDRERFIDSYNAIKT